MVEPFLVKDCALAVISTGESASSLFEMREILKRIPESSIYYHFWGEVLRPSFVHPEYHNDFAKWSQFILRDAVLAERLGVLDPRDYKTLQELREVLLDIIEYRIDETEYMFSSLREGKFYFLRSIIIVFNTDLIVAHPSDWKMVMPLLSSNAIYYHFIDARKRTETAQDDFSTWLKQWGNDFDELIKKINLVDPYFFSLPEIKQKLSDILLEHFG